MKALSCAPTQQNIPPTFLGDTAKYAHQYDGRGTLFRNVRVFWTANTQSFRADVCCSERTGPHPNISHLITESHTRHWNRNWRRGGRLVPGLYDMHSHTGDDWKPYWIVFSRITSVRDMGNSLRRPKMNWKKKLIREFCGPRNLPVMAWWRAKALKTNNMAYV